MLRKALILSAGHGTRLMPLTADRPKVMLPVAGQPLLAHHVYRLRDAGVREIFLNLHSHPEAVRNWFGDGSFFGVRIHYSLEPKLRGTAGAVNGFREHLNHRFLVQYGDVYSELDIESMDLFHERNGSAATLAVHPSSHPEDSDIVQLGVSGRVMGLHHKPGSMQWGTMGNAGCYILEPSVVSFVPDDAESDFIRDVFSQMLIQGLPLYGYQTSDFLFDMGTPERYEKLKARLARDDRRTHAISN